jgi:SAM-dependent methyltransferase
MSYFIPLSILFYSIIFVFLIWISGFLFGAPYESTYKKRLERMIKFSNIKKNEKIVDLGSGIGKVVIGYAKKGFKADGYEINPFLVWISRRKIKKLGLEKKAKIYQKNFMNQNLSKYDVVCIFQIWYMMNKLKGKLKKELKKGSRIISNTWKFKGWKPKKEDKGIYLYEV